MMEYPKIETLYNRDEATHRVRPGELRLPEFDLVAGWHATEKIDGTNVRVLLNHGAVIFREQPRRKYHPFSSAISNRPTEAVLFGEGYGGKIQKGRNYRPDASFRLFDVVVFGENSRAWWLTWGNVEDVAQKLNIRTVPVIEANVSHVNIAGRVKEGIESIVAKEESGSDGFRSEGIVCRTDPPLFTRDGRPLKFKLKTKDFPSAS